MQIATLLRDHRGPILERAVRRLHDCQLVTAADASEEKLRRTTEELLQLTLSSVQERNAGPMIAWGEQTARARFAAGCRLHEMQSLINTLESALWQTILEALPPHAFAEAIGFVSTALGMAKDALAREWVSLASKRRAPSLDMTALFSGTAAPATPEE